MQQAKRVAVNTGFLYVRLGITMFVSLYSTRLILGALGVKDFGLFNLVAGSIAMLTFLNNGMAVASQRFMSYARGEGNVEKQKNIFNVSVLLHIIIGLIVVLILEGAGYVLFNGVLKIDPERTHVAQLIYQFMLVSTFFTIISVPYDAVINARENMFLIAVVGIIQALLKLALALYITYTAHDKLVVYGLGMALLSIFVLLLQAFYCSRKYEEVKINLAKYCNRPLFNEMLSFAGWGFLGGSTSILSNYGQGIVLDMFFGTIVNAAQGVANQVSGQLNVFASSLQKAINPTIAQSEGAGNRAKMLRTSVMGSKVSFFLLMFLYVPVILEMPFILNLWLKQVPPYTIIFCKLLLCRRLIEQLYIMLSVSVSAVGDIKQFQIYKSLLNFFPLAISFILFKMGFPPYALYVAFIMYSILDASVTIYFAKIKCDLSVSHFLSNVVMRCFLSFSIVALISGIPLLIMPEGFLRFIIVGSLSVVCFVIFGGLVGFTEEERKNIIDIGKSFFGKIIFNFKTKLTKKIFSSVKRPHSKPFSGGEGLKSPSPPERDLG